jgi:hypothetical protein
MADHRGTDVGMVQNHLTVSHENTLQIQFAADKVRATMTLIPMRREVQGQRHAKTTVPLPMHTRGGAAQALSPGVDVCNSAVAVW